MLAWTVTARTCRRGALYQKSRLSESCTCDREVVTSQAHVVLMASRATGHGVRGYSLCLHGFHDLQAKDVCSAIVTGLGFSTTLVTWTE